MTTLYDRRFSVIVGSTGKPSIELGALRCVFQVKRGDFQNPNSCDIRIFNLSVSTANQIAGKEFSELTIQAGYSGNFGVIFTGNIKQKRLGRRDQKDSYIDITAADGDGLYNFSVMAESLAAGHQPKDAVQSILKSMAKSAAEQQGLNGSTAAPSTDSLTGYMPQFTPNQSLRGRVFYGMTRDELRDFAKTNYCSFSIQDGQLTFIPLTNYIPTTTTPLLVSPSAGLIGIPEQTAAGINVRLLLNPSIKIGHTIQLDASINLYRFNLDFESQNVTNAAIKQQNKVNAGGLYYVMVANHSGDTRGNEWFTDLNCLAVDATLSPQTNIQTQTLPDDPKGPIQVN